MPPDLRRIAHDVLCRTEPAFLKHYRRGRFRTWNGVAMTGSDLPGPGFNFAACLGDTPLLDAILPTAEAFFADADQGWGILVEGDAGHLIEAEVRSRGWAVAEDEPAFVMEHMTAGLNPAARPAELHIRPIRTAADQAAFQRITTRAYDAPPDLSDVFLPSPAYYLDPDMLWVLGEWAGEPVAAGGYYRSGTTAVIGGLATLDEYRGRGIGAAVARAALADAAAKGCTAAALRSGPKSVPLYERLGFRYVCQHRTYAAPRS